MLETKQNAATKVQVTNQRVALEINVHVVHEQ